MGKHLADGFLEHRLGLDEGLPGRAQGLPGRAVPRGSPHRGQHWAAVHDGGGCAIPSVGIPGVPSLPERAHRLLPRLPAGSVHLLICHLYTHPARFFTTCAPPRTPAHSIDKPQIAPQLRGTMISAEVYDFRACSWTEEVHEMRLAFGVPKSALVACMLGCPLLVPGCAGIWRACNPVDAPRLGEPTVDDTPPPVHPAPANDASTHTSFTQAGAMLEICYVCRSRSDRVILQVLLSVRERHSYVTHKCTELSSGFAVWRTASLGERTDWLRATRAHAQYISECGGSEEGSTHSRRLAAWECQGPGYAGERA